jgi:hypothetical protein
VVSTGTQSPVQACASRQQFAPLPKYQPRNFAQSLPIVLRIGWRTQFAHIPAIFILQTPVYNHPRRQLQMKLQSVTLAPISEGLPLSPI